MSTKATIVWLLIAIVLGGAAILLVRTGGNANRGTTAVLAVGNRVLRLDPARVSVIRIEHPDGSVESVRRAGAGAASEWTMRVRPAGATAEGPVDWPVVATRVQALIRHLNDVQVRALPGDGVVKDAAERVDVVTLEIVPGTGTDPSGAGGTITLRLGGQSVAGKALMEVEDATGAHAAKPARSRAIVDDSVHQLFRGGAAREWRDRTALYGAGLDASRVMMNNDKGVKLALGRVDGAWGVREPMSAPADPSVVQKLLSAVTAVQIVDFLDQGTTEASARLDRPAASVVIATDRREAPTTAPDAPTPAPGADPAARGALVVESHQLDIGGAADAAGTRLFARVDGERTVVIDARAVGDLKLDPTLYIWPFPTRLNASDIGTIAMERSGTETDIGGSVAGGTVYRRDLDKWKQIQSSGQEVLLPEAETRPVQALLGFLCGPSGSASTSTAPSGPLAIAGAAPEGMRPWGRITLLSLSGAPLDTLEVGGARPGTVTIRTNSIFRTYALDRVPSLIAMFARLPETPAPTGPGVGQVPESTK